MQRRYDLVVFGSMFTALGALIVIAGSPDIKGPDRCSIPKVNTKTETAYVLKPPPVPPQEIKSCPVAPEPKCPAPVAESAPTTEKVADTPPKRRYSKHRRYRRYWR